jgi:proton-dependent oligopeptide transporter, POT family
MKKITIRHPKEMYLLTLTATLQRSAFWGIANLFVLYLVQVYHMQGASADSLFGIVTGVAFILPIVGGWIADRTNYKIVVIAGLISTSIGCFLLMIKGMGFVYLAILFLSLGTGLATPGVYAILGQIYYHHQQLREGGFSIFYCIVNLGIFFTLIFLGWLGQAHGWSLVFLIAGVGSLLGLFPLFKVMKSPVVIESAKLQEKHEKKIKFAPKLHEHERDRIIAICVLSFFAILLWMGINQGGASLTLFALRYTDRQLFNFTIPPSWFLASESLFLFIFVYPMTSFYLYLVRRKIDFSPFLKCAIALIFLGLCFLLMVIGSLPIPPGATSAAISPLYLVGTYILMSLAEMLLVPIGLSLITHLSPHRYVAFLIGLWYFCIGIGLYLGGKTAGLTHYFTTLSKFFSFYVCTSFIGALILLALVKKLNRMRHLKDL